MKTSTTIQIQESPAAMTIRGRKSWAKVTLGREASLNIHHVEEHQARVLVQLVVERQSNQSHSLNTNCDSLADFLKLALQFFLISGSHLGADSLHALHLSNETFSVLTRKNRGLFNRSCHSRKQFNKFPAAKLHKINESPKNYEL